MTDHGNLARELENDAKQFAAHVLEIAKTSLGADVLTVEDREILERSRKNFGIYFEQLARLIDGLRKDGREVEAGFGYECLWNVVSGSFYIGSRGTKTKSSSRLAEIDQALLARNSRANSHYELALLAAIKSAYPAASCARPTKDAASILNLVNERLKSDGFEPVKVDKIRRRLEKLPRS